MLKDKLSESDGHNKHMKLGRAFWYLEKGGNKGF